MSGLDLIRETPQLRKPNIKRETPSLQAALLYIDRAEYDHAISILKQIVTKAHKTPDIYHWLGYCYKQKCEYYEALKYYQKSLSEIDYDSPYLFHIYKNMGNISVKQNDFDSAQEFYDKAFTINAHSDDLFVNYGTLEIQKQNLALALERFKQALDLNLFNDKAWVGLALIYRQMSDFNLAWADLQKAMDVNPHNQVALRVCVDWALQDMNYEIAKSAVEKFLKSHPNEIEWHYTYAGLLFQLGLWMDSLTEAHKVLDKNPNHILARELIRTLNLKLEN